MAVPFQFPPRGDPFESDIPVWMTFYIADYSTFNSRRTRAYVKSQAYAKITVPYPKAHSTLNSQRYVSGAAQNVQSIETGSFVGTLYQQITASKELATSFLSGGSTIRFDHFETVFEPGGRRTHQFNIDLIAKTPKQADMAAEIGLVFQGNCFPIAGTQSLLTMKHPPLWYFECVVPGYPGGTSRIWDGDPLVSVLEKVDINRAPVLNTGFITTDYKPVATNIKLSFIELEPAMQPGNGSVQIISRAERFVGAVRPF